MRSLSTDDRGVDARKYSRITHRQAGTDIDAQSRVDDGVDIASDVSVLIGGVVRITHDCGEQTGGPSPPSERRLFTRALVRSVPVDERVVCLSGYGGVSSVHSKRTRRATRRYKRAKAAVDTGSLRSAERSAEEKAPRAQSPGLGFVFRSSIRAHDIPEGSFHSSPRAATRCRQNSRRSRADELTHASFVVSQLEHPRQSIFLSFTPHFHRWR